MKASGIYMTGTITIRVVINANSYGFIFTKDQQKKANS